MTPASTVHAEGARYRIDRPTFSVIMRDLRIPRDDVGPGDKIPHIDLPTTDGGRFTPTASPRMAVRSCSSSVP